MEDRLFLGVSPELRKSLLRYIKTGEADAKLERALTGDPALRELVSTLRPTAGPKR